MWNWCLLIVVLLFAGCLFGVYCLLVGFVLDLFVDCSEWFVGRFVGCFISGLFVVVVFVGIIYFCLIWYYTIVV